jgi:hypothetical protein
MESASRSLELSMLFFVEGKVRKSGPYILKPEIVEHRGLIEAVDHDQACEKYEKHWADKTEEYNIYYSTLNYTITEIIT